MSRYIDIDEAIPIVIQAVVDIVGHGISQIDAIRIVEKFKDAPFENVVKIKQGEILLPLTEEELSYLLNDTIAYIWSMENTGRTNEEFGYFSRIKLKKKLDYFLKMLEKPIACGKRREE